jgi:hypothetical protein
MQALWSRAASAHACGCRACVQATNATVRQTTTRPPRRSPVVANILAACYSSLLITAVVADGANKETRQKQLDSRLDRAKAELARLILEAPDLDRTCPEDHLIKNHRYTGAQGVMETLKCMPRSPEKIQERMRIASLRAGQWAKLLPPSRRKNLDVGLVHLGSAKFWEKQSEEEKAIEPLQGEPATPAQRSMLASEMCNLVDNLLRAAYLECYPDAESRRLAYQDANGPWAKIKQLQSLGYPRYADSTSQRELTWQARKKLNRVLQRVFDSRDTDERGLPEPLSKVYKICHNLLVFVVPPGIQNFNLLMGGLHNLGLPGLVRPIAQWLVLENSILRPTEQTVLCLMDHFAVTNDGLGVAATMWRLGWQDLDANIKEMPIPSFSALLWSKPPTILRQGFRMTPGARLLPSVVDSVFHSIISLSTLEDAATLFATCMRVGWTMGFDVFENLLHKIIQNVDTFAARIVVMSMFESASTTRNYFIDLIESGHAYGDLLVRLQDVIYLASTTTLSGFLSRGLLMQHKPQRKLATIDASKWHDLDRGIEMLALASYISGVDEALGLAASALHRRHRAAEGVSQRIARATVKLDQRLGDIASVRNREDLSRICHTGDLSTLSRSITNSFRATLRLTWEFYDTIWEPALHLTREDILRKYELPFCKKAQPWSSDWADVITKRPEIWSASGEQKPSPETEQGAEDTREIGSHMGWFLPQIENEASLRHPAAGVELSANVFFPANTQIPALDIGR